MKKLFLIFIVLYSINAFAYFNENVPNKCGVLDNKIFAYFTANQYTCQSGEFLPAYTIGCQTCPTGYTCPGGTYSFNETEFQGAIKLSGNITNNLTDLCSTNAPHVLFGIFAPNQHTCSAGYYLPANVDACTICPQNNLCVGGTFSFNETTDQGIEPCPNGGFAPAGSSSICYPHALHVGDDVVYLSATKRTTPALNVEVNGTVFYANITATPTVMSVGSTHYFKTIVNDMEHYICDDTSCPQ